MSQAQVERINQTAMEIYAARLEGEMMEPAYNTAPTEQVPAIVENEDGTYRRETMQWGVVPYPGAPIVTNARDDSLLTKRMFKDPVQRRRCVVFADGFYEWQTIGKTKIPHYFFLKGRRPFVFAGLYEPAQVPDGPRRCMIVTTEPNELLVPFHNRMPVILPFDVSKRWLSDVVLTPENLPEFCRPYPVADMEEYRTDSKMSNSRYKAADAIEPWKPDGDELDLGV